MKLSEVKAEPGFQKQPNMDDVSPQDFRELRMLAHNADIDPSEELKFRDKIIELYTQGYWLMRNLGHQPLLRFAKMVASGTEIYFHFLDRINNRVLGKSDRVAVEMRKLGYKLFDEFDFTDHLDLMVFVKS